MDGKDPPRINRDNVFLSNEVAPRGKVVLKAIDHTHCFTRGNALSARLADGLDRAATDAGVPHVVQRVGSMLTLFFNADAVHNYDDAKRSDTSLFGRFFWEMLARGVYLPCSQFEAAFVSAAHTEDDIDRTILAARESLRAITR